VNALHPATIKRLDYKSFTAFLFTKKKNVLARLVAPQKPVLCIHHPTSLHHPALVPTFLVRRTKKNCTVQKQQVAMKLSVLWLPAQTQSKGSVFAYLLWSF